MQNIYIHIPFCSRKCPYCNFYSITDLDPVSNYIDSLLEEIRGNSDHLSDNKIDSVYIGGGSPSLIEPVFIEKIINELNSIADFSEETEITIEVNPESVTKSKLLKYRSAGINRVSIGVQSFFDDELLYLGRVHDVKSAKEAIELAGKCLENISIDIIYSLPGQTTEKIIGSLAEAVKYPVKHISSYELEIDKECSLYSDLYRNDEDNDNYRLVTKFLNDHGFERYEISNYSRKGYECRHNLSYWNNKSYIGFGAAAHSFDSSKKIRWSNFSDVKSYAGGKRYVNKEIAEDIDYLIMGLRKSEGMLLTEVPTQYKRALFNFEKEGYFFIDDNNIRYTEKGLMISNRLLVEIMKKSESTEVI